MELAQGNGASLRAAMAALWIELPTAPSAPCRATPIETP